MLIHLARPEGRWIGVGGLIQDGLHFARSRGGGGRARGGDKGEGGGQLLVRKDRDRNEGVRKSGVEKTKEKKEKKKQRKELKKELKKEQKGTANQQENGGGTAAPTAPATAAAGTAAGGGGRWVHVPT